MSSTNNIRCNTVIINNHASRPSYKEVLVSNSVQPSPVKVHSEDQRSTGIGLDAESLYGIGRLMGPKNESASTSQSGPQEKVIPENGRKETNMARKAGISKDHQYKGKFDPRYGLLKQKAINKHDSIKRRSVPHDQHVKEIKIDKGCSEKKTTNPGCNDQKRKEGWTNRGGTDQKSKTKLLPNWKLNPNYKKVNLMNVSKDGFKEVKMPKYYKIKNQNENEINNSKSTNDQTCKNQSIWEVLKSNESREIIKHEKEKKLGDEPIKFSKIKAPKRIVVETKVLKKEKRQHKAKHVSNAVNELNEDHLEDSDQESYENPIFKSIQHVIHELNKIGKLNAGKVNYHDDHSTDNYSTDEEFRRLARQPSRRERNVLNNIESLIKKIELYPKSNHSREIKITRLVKQINKMIFLK